MALCFCFLIKFYYHNIDRKAKITNLIITRGGNQKVIDLIIKCIDEAGAYEIMNKDLKTKVRQILVETNLKSPLIISTSLFTMATIIVSKGMQLQVFNGSIKVFISNYSTMLPRLGKFVIAGIAIAIKVVRPFQFTDATLLALALLFNTKINCDEILQKLPSINENVAYVEKIEDNRNKIFFVSDKNKQVFIPKFQETKQVVIETIDTKHGFFIPRFNDRPKFRVRTQTENQCIPLNMRIKTLQDIKHENDSSVQQKFEKIKTEF